MCVSARDKKEAAWNMRPAFLIALGICCLSNPSPARTEPAYSPPSVEQLLRRLLRSERSCNLRGRQRVVFSGPQRPLTYTTTKVVRTREGRSLAVCLEPARQRGAVTLDDGEWTKYYNPRVRRITIARSIPRVRDERTLNRFLRLILRNYRVTFEGEEPIAGRTCYRLDFTPRVEPNSPPVAHPVKLWMDVRTGAILGNQENDLRGNTLAVSFFTSVEFPKRIAREEVSYRFPRRAPRDIFSRSPILHDIAPLRSKAGFDITLPLSMPGGYEFDHCELLSFNGVPAVCLRYTNGLSNITICQNPSRMKRPRGIRRIAVKTSPQGEVMVACACGPMDFMIVGRGDPNGLVAIARALDGERERNCMTSLAQTFQVKPALLAMMRNQGLCVDSMAALLAIEAETGRKLDSLLALHREGYCWRSIAEQLKLDPTRIKNRIRRFEMR
jgi:hypothetical protein